MAKRKATSKAKRRDLTDPQKRATYLGQVCAGDQALRERVEALLDVHEREQSFLQSAEQSLPETVDRSSTLERPGTIIGRYKLRPLSVLTTRAESVGLKAESVVGDLSLRRHVATKGSFKFIASLRIAERQPSSVDQVFLR